MHSGSLAWAVKQLGRHLDDRNADGTLALYIGSTTSSIRIPRAVEAIDDAQQELFYMMLDEAANRELLAREVALSTISGDTISYGLSRRTIEVFGVRTGAMGTDDEPFPGMYGSHYGDYGYTIGQRGESIKWHNFQPDSSQTYYARVVEEPAQLAYGGFLDATTNGSTVWVADSAEYGELPLEADNLNGCVLVVESGTGKGSTSVISDYANSGSTTKITLASTVTVEAASKYSIMLSVPRSAWRPVLLKAAANLAPFVAPHKEESILRRFAAAWQPVLEILRNPTPDAYAKVWRVRHW